VALEDLGPLFGPQAQGQGSGGREDMLPLHADTMMAPKVS
jgi:hypothetical protein